jgi:hypothetical protein
MAPRSNREFTRRLRTRVVPLAAFAFVATCGGCEWLPRWSPAPPKPEPCVFSPNPTREEIVSYINLRASKLEGWQCSDARISSKSLPFRLDAHIAVQRSKNFRLVASSLGGVTEFDFGSNAERLWFWMGRDKSKKVFTVRHDQLDTVEDRMPFPFRPDWLLEALGVIPLDPQNVRMLPRQPGDKLARLVSREYTPAGRIVQRTIVVDCCNGNVLSQTLEDPGGKRLLMKAEFNSFQTERHSGLKMPYRIDLYWPQADMSMTLWLGTLQINPAEFAPKTWQLPHYNGCATLDLARGLAAAPRSNGARQMHYQGPPPGRMRIQPLRNERPVFEEEKATVRPIPQFREDSKRVTPIGDRTALPREPGPFAQPFPGAPAADRPQFADD